MFLVKDLYQAYYTKSEPIVRYMVSQLDINENDKLLEPCGGDGVFIDEIINNYKNVKIDIFELNPSSYSSLISKYANCESININLSDTLLDSDLDLKAKFGGYYDKIIANPPYGAWLEYDKRKLLKKKYPNFYVKESYALFLSRAINLLKPKGKLVFIIPDTYLNLHMHKTLRHQILTETKINEIALFPSSFFPGVNFGYANLSIISLEKTSNSNEALKNNFTIYTDYISVNNLGNLNVSSYCLTQHQILNNPDYAFLVAKNPLVTKCMQETKNKIGDIADCVTGFYSGNDKVFLKVLSKDVKNGKKYEVVDTDKIYKQNCNQTLLNGIKGEEYFIPILKGGNGKFLKEDYWFINWSYDSVMHYKTDAKARFQNSKYYFKKGIAVPMISSSRITASLITNKIFDQSIVGIFPHNEDYLFYLLAFFNSNTCNLLIRTINPSANNPANYIKKIPIIFPSESDLLFINKFISDILQQLMSKKPFDKKWLVEIDNYFKNIYGF